MNKLIYDIRRNKYLQKLIDDRESCFYKPFYIEFFGRYGSDEWWNNVEKAGLIEILQGRITRVMPSGKSSIPQFELNVDDELLVFNAEGDEGIYPVGGVVKIFTVKNDDVFVEKLGGYLVIRVELLN